MALPAPARVGGGAAGDWAFPEMIRDPNRETGFRAAVLAGPGRAVRQVRSCAMALRKLVHRMTATVEELDRESLVEYCDRLGVLALTAVEPRRRVRIGGEVCSVRIVPRAGAPSFEVTITDGRATATAVFLGRRSVGGMIPGRRLVVEGVAARDGKRNLIFNPFYTLLP